MGPAVAKHNVGYAQRWFAGWNARPGPLKSAPHL